MEAPKSLFCFYLVFIYKQKTMKLTINQALDNLYEKVIKLNLEQQDLSFNLRKLKSEHGGRTSIENFLVVRNIIEHGNKNGIIET